MPSNESGAEQLDRAAAAASLDLAPAVRGEPSRRSVAAAELARSPSSSRISRADQARRADDGDADVRHPSALRAARARDAHRAAADRGSSPGPREVGRAVPRRDHAGDGAPRSRPPPRAQAERVAAEHRRREDRRERIRPVLSGDVGRRAVDRLVEAAAALPGTGAPASDADGSMPIEPASIDASSVRMSPKRFSVAITSKSRGRRMRCIAIASTSTSSYATSGYSRAHLVRDLAPQARRREDVRLVDRREPAAALAGEREGRVQQARDLLLGVDAACRRPRGPRRVVAPLARLAEVDAAGQLADDDQVDALEHLGPERRRPRSAPARSRPDAGWRRRRGPCAAPRSACSGRTRRRRVVPLGAADGAEQDGVAPPAPAPARPAGSGSPRRVDRGAADRPARELEREPVARRDRLEHGDGLGRHLAARCRRRGRPRSSRRGTRRRTVAGRRRAIMPVWRAYAKSPPASITGPGVAERPERVDGARRDVGDRARLEIELRPRRRCGTRRRAAPASRTG